MRKKIATAAIIGSIGLTGGLLIGPGLASAADSTTGTSTGVSGRLTAIKDALKSLVTDKTITQAQADKVATTLDQNLPQRGEGMGGGRQGGPGGPGRMGQGEAAKVIGITPAELRAQLEAGKTLAQIATANGVSKADLIAGLVKAEEAQLAQAVTDGKITQAQADKVKATLKDRVTTRVDQVGKAERGGHRGGDRDDATAPSGDATATPSSTSSSNA